MVRVRIREEQPRELRCGRTQVDSMIFTHPARRKLTRAQHSEFGHLKSKLREDRGRSVRRAVIHNDDLANLRLSRDGFDRSRDRGSFISGRNDG
jgi:hypothetical protein